MRSCNFTGMKTTSHGQATRNIDFANHEVLLAQQLEGHFPRPVSCKRGKSVYLSGVRFDGIGARTDGKQCNVENMGWRKEGLPYYEAISQPSKKAVIINVSYFTSRSEVYSPDSSGLTVFLHQIYGFDKDHIVFLSDRFQRPTSQPTMKNILKALRWLVADCGPLDQLLLFYSGHGEPRKDIVPVVFKDHGYIAETDLQELTANRLVEGVSFTYVLDWLATSNSAKNWFDEASLTGALGLNQIKRKGKEAR
ncbi:hypothetical protein FOYG_03938 [Fusarium oxysporum NRRL 32931]|uniref:Peptidase C14 caspase domain-containing protein n=1 Tax=Fusarium oxysporum NRRL 32931 TaxID=660029 RepID=W9J362_FUSOX|nr:hypothetical protein FOYG_03938 [Fusarium oxysporum NRRL 32931]